MSDLRWPWVLPVVAVAVVVLLLWWARRPRSRRGEQLLVAGTAQLRALPRYRALVRRHRLLGVLLTVGALVVVAGSALALARPQVVEEQPREAKSRDIMLCLDASASMDADNREVVAALRQVVEGLDGDRIGMVVWSGSALLVFPLTDDRTFVEAQLDRAERAFSGKPDGFFNGLDAPEEGASLIGDGLVSCVQRFDREAEERTRAVVLTSDNDLVGEPVYPLPQAARYAEKRDVRVYSIGATSLAETDRAPAREELAQASAETGGTLVMLGQDGSADQLVDRIDQLEQARADEPPRRVTRDDPLLGRTVGLVGLGVLLLAWLLQALLSPRRPGRSRRTTGGGA